ARVAAGIGVDSLPRTRGRPGTDTNTNANANANTNANANANTNTDPNPHANPNPDSHAGANPDSHAEANAVAHSHTNANPDANSGAEPIDVYARRVRRPLSGWPVTDVLRGRAVAELEHRALRGAPAGRQRRVRPPMLWRPASVRLSAGGLGRRLLPQLRHRQRRRAAARDGEPAGLRARRLGWAASVRRRAGSAGHGLLEKLGHRQACRHLERRHRRLCAGWLGWIA